MTETKRIELREFDEVKVISFKEKNLFDERTVKDVSDQIECNAYLIALRRGQELTIFISVAERQGVRLRILPPLAEQERVMEFLMNPGSAQVVTFQVAAR